MDADLLAESATMVGLIGTDAEAGGGSLQVEGVGGRHGNGNGNAANGKFFDRYSDHTQLYLRVAQCNVRALIQEKEGL